MKCFLMSSLGILNRGDLGDSGWTRISFRELTTPQKKLFLNGLPTERVLVKSLQRKLFLSCPQDLLLQMVPKARICLPYALGSEG